MKLKLGVGVFVRKDNKILLGKRISKTHGNGEWSLPGGNLEKWESLKQCCLREVSEETGLSIKNIQKLIFTNDMFPEADLHYITLYFTADPAGGELINKEPHKCERWEWFKLTDLPQPLFCGINEVVSTSKIF
ncbi:MAG TPA: NUDIX domain-containing protein [Nitrospirae bacterium]|nr:8-oxo-dGTP diphosphatase [bacterium BMS3Abin10]GBE39229.1 8-oxo-dGTP diphosphatase [bacterium BMS3Bbin08]HDH00633.1 NUDIX domain-containing protein [Nitrospirota bacterium]HDH51736.1 NUDIX domain-containing protein [Nitrospirota bacterium]HDK81618.1 NUDIX domain-containing protein [Nitrospirota bacterium]